jgi:hypothetical protein
MKTYSNIITLSKNKRGIWDFDTVKGCESGLLHSINGCYNDCYAYKTAKRYGIDFSKSINRHFENYNHKQQIIKMIEKIDMPFIRIGCSGDPSEDWEHTISIIEQLKNSNQHTLFPLESRKQIVIITRHWKLLTENQLSRLKKYNVCINTSVSALDSNELIQNSLKQYNRLKPYCKSVLRVVTCDFNKENKTGYQLDLIQKELLKNELVIDTVFRPSKNNTLITNSIINTKKMSFMKSKSLVSKNNKKAFLGKCANCIEMCGINM